jgi:hypothetical protein
MKFLSRSQKWIARVATEAEWKQTSFLTVLSQTGEIACFLADHIRRMT